jgi:16S rRNA (adenine1518-N6/adenine1519-N6)-dimethyltransferase
MKAKKQFGQNFLTSVPARIKIVQAGNITPGEWVVEVGPGTGFLTEELLRAGARVLALEKDRDLLPLLREKFSHAIENGHLVLQEQDVLSFMPEDMPVLGEGYKVIANIPYYITGAIFRHFLARPHKPTTMVVLIQKEVAERIVARDGKESILSLSVSVYGKPRIVTRVDKGSFNPRPNVDSAVLAIDSISQIFFKNPYEEEMFFKMVHAGFLHKRKLLVSNLQHIFPSLPMRKLFEESSVDVSIRAEKLLCDDWIRLVRTILLATKTGH